MDERRPVAVAAAWNVVWTRESESASIGSASM